jgi:hypothetical protein
MTTQKGTFFEVKKTELGRRLIMRDPTHNPQARDALATLGPIPNSVTVGYFRPMADMPGMWAFMPASSPAAMAVLRVSSVRDRIAEDLAILIQPVVEAREAAKKENTD